MKKFRSDKRAFRGLAGIGSIFDGALVVRSEALAELRRNVGTVSTLWGFGTVSLVRGKVDGVLEICRKLDLDVMAPMAGVVLR